MKDKCRVARPPLQPPSIAICPFPRAHDPTASAASCFASSYFRSGFVAAVMGVWCGALGAAVAQDTGRKKMS